MANFRDFLKISIVLSIVYPPVHHEDQWQVTKLFEHDQSFNFETLENYWNSSCCRFLDSLNTKLLENLKYGCSQVHLILFLIPNRVFYLNIEAWPLQLAKFSLVIFFHVKHKLNAFIKSHNFKHVIENFWPRSILLSTPKLLNLSQVKSGNRIIVLTPVPWGNNLVVAFSCCHFRDMIPRYSRICSWLKTRVVLDN